MEKLISVLSSEKPGIDWANETDVLEDGLLDSMDLISIIPAIEEAFDIEIGMEYMDTENFESAEKMWAMIQEIQGEA